MNAKQRRKRNRIVFALVLFVAVYLICEFAPLDAWLASESAALYLEFALFLIPYLIAGYDVLARAGRNIVHGHVFDENFLMSIATIGAFGLVFFPESDPHMAEGAAVMLFYQVGELFESYAVGKTRRSIADMMDIAPEYATVVGENGLTQVDPADVAVGTEILVKPGERVPLDGVVVEGTSQLDTAALTGESVPRDIGEGDGIISGCVNLTGVLSVRTTKPYGESTVSRILELVENASEKKARTENFITRFARYYTPAVVVVAFLLAIVAPLFFGQAWSDWIQRGLIFLVVSCPCALVISVPLSFFGGIGGASRLGILVKGSNYLEALAKVDTVIFDKTGTLTSGTFEVTGVFPANDSPTAPDDARERLIETAAYAEGFSTHPIAASVRNAYGKPLEHGRIEEASELSGHGVSARIDGRQVLVGNDKLMEQNGISVTACDASATVLHVALDGAYTGRIEISDVLKSDAADALAGLRDAGVKRSIMLTGDREAVARRVATTLGIDEFHAELLPEDKVSYVERILEEHGRKSETAKVAFVGDGINDAPVLMRADIGIAMGGMGSDAAIEAADIVLMDDRPSNIARAVRIARKTMGIVWQNIVFALAVKFGVLLLAAFGAANLWLAVFADVGVAVLAILNAMRCMNVRKMAK